MPFSSSFLCPSSHLPLSPWCKRSSTKGHLGNQQGHGCQKWEMIPGFLVQTLEARVPGGWSPPTYWHFGSLLQTQSHSLQSQQQEGNFLKGFIQPEAAGFISHLFNFVGALLSHKCNNISRGFQLHSARKVSALGIFQTRADGVIVQPCFSIPISVQPRHPEGCSCEAQRENAGPRVLPDAASMVSGMFVMKPHFLGQ